MIIISTIILLAVTVFFCTLLIKLLAIPMRLIFKLIINALMGFFILLLFNFFSGFLDFSLGMNFINCLVAGVFGVPGVIFLVLLKLIF